MTKIHESHKLPNFLGGLLPAQEARELASKVVSAVRFDFGPPMFEIIGANGNGPDILVGVTMTGFWVEQGGEILVGLSRLEAELLLTTRLSMTSRFTEGAE